MLIKVREFKTVFNSIKSDHKNVLLFVAYDVDSLCSLRMLASLFQCESIKYDIIPISNYYSMNEACISHLKGNYSVKTIFVINCGAMVDLSAVVFQNCLEPHQVVYVIDSHRPFHLKNIFGRTEFNKNLFFVSEDTIDGEQFEPFSKLFSEQNDATLENTWNVISKLDNYHGQIDALTQPQVEQTRQDDMDEDQDEIDAAFFDQDDLDDLDDFIDRDEEDDDRAFDDDEYDPTARNRTRSDDDDDDNEQDEPLGVRRRDFKTKEDFETYIMAAKYYRKSYRAPPSSHLIYKMIQISDTSLLSSSRLHNNVLWSAIVGLTEQLEFEYISHHDYKNLMNWYFGRVVETNPSIRPQMLTDDGAMIPVTDDERISFQECEFKLMLYRHWSLYESMRHTMSIMSQLDLYKHNANKQLHDLLARIGVGLTQCQQNYSNMMLSDKDRFFAGFKKECKDYKLSNVMYSSFIKHYGSTLQVSASDMVHSLIALMEMPTSSLPKGSANGSNHMSADLWENNFTTAYEALNGNTTLIRKGIQRSIHMQRAMIKQIIFKMDTSSSQGRNTAFRSIFLKAMDLNSFSSSNTNQEHNHGDGDDGNGDLVLSPMTVSRLGLMFMEIYRRTDEIELPIVISVPTPNSDGSRSDLIVGIGTRSSGHKFGSCFKKAYQDLDISGNVKHVGFGSAAIEIPSEKTSDFTSTLFCLMKAQ
ncbi:cell division control protein 45 [Acrasis kona]|uniref:Cell division control protein 45 n=1 Tax=Acrasis kona TaxID=1008807 RepID=A0AAW2ZEF3_9EUKA